MFVREVLLRVGDGLRDVPLPVERDAAEVRLVADLEVDVVEITQCRNPLSDEGILNLQQLAVFQGAAGRNRSMAGCVQFPAARIP